MHSHGTAQPAAKSEKNTCAGNQVCRLITELCIYQCILRTAWYILRYTTLYLESGSSRLASLFCLCCPLVPCNAACIACDLLPLPSLLDGQAPKAGLAAPKQPQPLVDFVDIAAPSAPSSVQSSSVGTAKWEACFLALAEHVRDSRSRVTSQKQKMG
jgi:hypothetical protein